MSIENRSKMMVRGLAENSKLLSFVVVFLEMLKGHFTSVELFLLQSTVVAEGIGLLRDQNFTG